MERPPGTNPGQIPGLMRVLKEEGGRAVYLVEAPDGSPELLKCWPLHPWEVVKACLGIAQAERQLRGARRLIAAGVATPAIRRGLHLAGSKLCIRLAWVEGTPLLDAVRGAGPEEAGRLGSEVGGVLRAIAEARLFHRDCKLSNFILRPDGSVVAIDPVGVRRARQPSAERERMLTSLGCELGPGGRDRHTAFLAAARRALMADG